MQMQVSRDGERHSVSLSFPLIDRYNLVTMYSVHGELFGSDSPNLRLHDIDHRDEIAKACTQPWFSIFHQPIVRKRRPKGGKLRTLLVTYYNNIVYSNILFDSRARFIGY